MRLLHIDSSISGDRSVSRQLTAAIVARLAQATSGLEIIYRDVYRCAPDDPRLARMLATLPDPVPLD